MPEHSEDLKVIVSMDRYEELIRKAEHYDNIIDAALRGATLSSWNNKINLDMSSVEDYIKVVEGQLVADNERVLQAFQAAKERAEAQEAE